MDRRSFGKLLAGTMTAAGISRVSVAEERQRQRSKGKTLSIAGHHLRWMHP